MSKRSYNRQFRDEACKLVREKGYAAAQAARELGIPTQTLHNWLKQRKAASVPTLSGDPAVLQVHIRELEGQVHRLEMERDILKKATAYFASQGR
jgi:transposase